MKYLVIFIVILGLLFLYRNPKCYKYNDVVIWEKDGVQVIDKVVVYDCGE